MSLTILCLKRVAAAGDGCEGAAVLTCSNDGGFAYICCGVFEELVDLSEGLVHVGHEGFAENRKTASCKNFSL